MCNGIKFVLLGCEKHSQNQRKNGQKTAIFRLLIFAKIVHTTKPTRPNCPKPTPLPHMRLCFIRLLK